MSEGFAEGAARLQGLAARSLGWTPATFWNATPDEFLLALAPPADIDTAVSREEIAAMIERDRHG